MTTGSSRGGYTDEEANKFVVSVICVMFKIVFYGASLLWFIWGIFNFCRWLAL